jgi:hypothetical protein
MKAISKKSRKNASVNTIRLTTMRKPSTPPGNWSNRCSTQTSPSSPRNTRVKMVEPIRMKMTKVVSLVVLSIAWVSCRRLNPPARQRQQQRAGRAHRTALGGGGDAEEDGAEHQEDQHQRRNQRGEYAQQQGRTVQGARAEAGIAGAACGLNSVTPKDVAADTAPPAPGRAAARPCTCRRPRRRAGRPARSAPRTAARSAPACRRRR